MAGCDHIGYPGDKSLRDARGNYIGFFINGTETDHATGIINMTTEAGDYVPVMDNADKTFRICIEAVGVAYVQLADGTDFTVTNAQTTKYLGDWLPLNIIKVYKTGTTATFSVGY
jgi:hypothetical protein